MQLDHLSFAELQELRGNLNVLPKVGAILSDFDLVPVFSLMPGHPATIVLPVVLPPMPQAALNAFNDNLDTVLAGQCERLTALVIALGQAPAADLTSLPVQAADDAPPAVIASAAGVDDIPSAPVGQSSQVQDRQDDAAATGAETPVPPADLDEKPNQPARWTDAKDAQLVALVQARLARGATKGRAVAEAASALGRPVEGTAFRLRKLTLVRLPNPAAHVAAPAAPIAAVKQTFPQGDGGSPDGGGAAGSTQTPAVTPAVPLPPGHVPSDLEVHLSSIARPAPWSLASDEELMSLAQTGWGIPEIALHMQIDAREVKRRWDQLTALDVSGERPIRRFKGIDVAIRLTAMLAAGV